MITDKYGQQIYDEQDLCNLYLSDPNIRLKNVLVSDPIIFDPNLNLDHIPKIIQYTVSDQTIDDFDSSNRQNWFIPDAYKDFDIAKFVLEQCASEPELQRAGEELILYQDRNMIMLLRYLKYLVDTMRSNKVVWGVGRGSSVSSFVLYLIGVHKINSLYYDLSITEFLK